MYTVDFINLVILIFSTSVLYDLDLLFFVSTVEHCCRMSHQHHHWLSLFSRNTWRHIFNRSSPYPL